MYGSFITLMWVLCTLQFYDADIGIMHIVVL